MECLSKIKPGDTIYTVLRHVSRSGMMRHISLKAIVDGQIIDITWAAAVAMGDTFTRDNHTALKVTGCGMDLGFNVVYNLSHVLFGKKVDGDAGYALNQSWL
jgi:hypothetical protein